ncbi:MAG: PQQ-binding-like beta-propeller repeat protein [Planctomycetota bacterium]
MYRTRITCLFCLCIIGILGFSSCRAIDVPAFDETEAPAEGAKDPEADVESGEGELLQEWDDLSEHGMKVSWQQDLGQVAEGGSRIWRLYQTGKIVVVETRDGVLFYFHADNGVWGGSTPLRGQLWEQPVMEEDRIYAVSAEGILDISLRTGSLDRRMRPRTPVSCPPVYYNDSLILGSGNGHVVRFMLEDGAHQWTVKALGSINPPVVASDDVIYAAGRNGRVISVDGINGRRRWTWHPTEPSYISSGPALNDGRLYVGDNRGYIYSITAEDGVVQDKYSCGAPITAAPVALEDRLLVFAENSEMLCLDTEDGFKKLWEHPTALRLIGRSESNLYFLTHEGTVACVERASGEEQWEFPLPDDALVAGDASSPRFYFASPDGRIVAISELEVD